MQRYRLAETQVRKLFSPWMLFLCLVGLSLNLILSKLVILFGLPLYIDNVGSILTAALGGALPGVTVGFFSNAFGSISEPISMYYSILTVIIAWLASIFSRKGLLKKWTGWLLASGSFILIGGAIGSVMTWFLYGGGIGGIAAPYAHWLNNHGVSPFFSQLSMDILIDIPDKLLTVGIVCLILRFYPKVLAGKFPLSYLYDGTMKNETNGTMNFYQEARHSVSKRLTTIVGIAVSLISVLSVVIGSYYHQRQMISDYETIAEVVSQQVADCVDGDFVEQYLQMGDKADGYRQTEKQMYTIFNNISDIKHLYVYSLLKGENYVVFDLDTPEQMGQAAGTLVEHEYQKNRTGTLVSAYTPIYNSEGKTVAYGCVDIDMTKYVLKMMIYIIQVISILFAVAILTVFFTLWYVNRQITTPIRMIVDQTQALNQISPENWLTSEAWINRTPIHTNDELEELYKTVTMVDENASRNVKRLIETEQELMQTKELENINRELELTIKKADEANRAKTEFLSRMSHDIRTPLNAILGTATLAKDEINNPEAIEESLEVITTAGQFLLGLINDILDINKIENGTIDLHPEAFDVSEFIYSIENTIRPLAEKKEISFHFEINCEECRSIVVDKLRYKQIFFNLLSNAIKYTPRGGQVSFIADVKVISEGMAEIRNCVRDNGIGMSEEYMKHLYEPFTRDQNVSINKIEGSGLGLAIVKNIVDSIGGTINVTSELGKGTEFVVTMCLPVSDTETQMEIQNQIDVNMELKNKRILLVEDNEINIQIAKKLLEKKDCIVTTAVNGLEAVNLVAASTERRFDLILMDIRMPVMDGLEAAKKIQALQSTSEEKIPIVAMTANAYTEDIKKSLDAGMCAHLSKPIESDKVFSVIMQYVL